MQHPAPSPDWPLTVAHRAGNDLRTLHEAEAAGADLVEADLWFHGGRVEVRHLKTMGPVPLLWDRWRLASARAPRLLLDDLLQAVQPATGLLFDLKGRDPRLSPALLEATRRWMPGRPYTVAARTWRHLDAFDGDGVRVVYSVGYRWKLGAVMERLGRRPGSAVAIHRGLLNEGRVARLRDRSPLVITWPVNDERWLRRLLGWGVNGVISDNLDLLRDLAGRRRTDEARPGESPER